MAKRKQTARQQLTDTEWRVIAPRLWAVVPKVGYEWRISEAVEAKLRKLVPCPNSRPAGSCGKECRASGSPLQQNSALRREIEPILRSANTAKLTELAVWIIRDWGGIPGGPRSDRPDPLSEWAGELVGFSPASVERFLLKHGVDRVSSWSKLLAFADSEKYAIFDTRVAVTLNIALRAIGERHQFHLSTGRNKIVSRAAAALGTVSEPLGYLDYLSLLRALKSEGGQTILFAETTFFAAAPQMAASLMARMDEHLNEACVTSC